MYLLGLLGHEEEIITDLQNFYNHLAIDIFQHPEEFLIFNKTPVITSNFA